MNRPSILRESWYRLSTQVSIHIHFLMVQVLAELRQTMNSPAPIVLWPRGSCHRSLPSTPPLSFPRCHKTSKFSVFILSFIRAFFRIDTDYSVDLKHLRWNSKTIRVIAYLYCGRSTSCSDTVRTVPHSFFCNLLGLKILLMQTHKQRNQTSKYPRKFSKP